MKTNQEILAEDYARQMEKRAETKLLECQAAVEEYLATIAEQETKIQQPVKELELVHEDTDQLILDAINRIPEDLFATEEEAAAVEKLRARDPEGFKIISDKVDKELKAKWEAEREAQEAEQKLQKTQAEAVEYKAKYQGTISALISILVFIILVAILAISGFQPGPGPY